MRIKSRLLKLENSINSKNKEYLFLMFIENQNTSYNGKQYKTFDDLKKDYPTIEDDYKLSVINIICE